MTSFSKSDKILIVGGTGFIGRHLVKRCLSITPFVTCLGLTGKNNKDIASQDLEILQADIRNREQVRKALTGKSFDYVINLAGYIDHTKYFEGGREIIESHFNGLMNLIDSLGRERLKGFVQIGSSDEYGSAPVPQKETSRECPFSPYSLAKAASTHYIRMLHRTEKFPGVVLRFFLVYGPYQNEDRFLPQIIKGCLKDESFKTTKGEQLRDFCYVEDVVNAIMKAIVLPEAKGQVINVASGIPVSVRSVIEKVVSLVGKGRPCFGERPYRERESMQLYADINLAGQVLGWVPDMSLEDGLVKTINYYKEQIENE